MDFVDPERLPRHRLCRQLAGGELGRTAASGRVRRDFPCSTIITPLCPQATRNARRNLKPGNSNPRWRASKAKTQRACQSPRESIAGGATKTLPDYRARIRDLSVVESGHPRGAGPFMRRTPGAERPGQVWQRPRPGPAPRSGRPAAGLGGYLATLLPPDGTHRRAGLGKHFPANPAANSRKWHHGGTHRARRQETAARRRGRSVLTAVTTPASIIWAAPWSIKDQRNPRRPRVVQAAGFGRAQGQSGRAAHQDQTARDVVRSNALIFC